jgi:hypothetical protein
MSILPGHENLKDCRIIQINTNGTALVDCGDKGLSTYELFVSASGTLHARLPKVEGIDQVGGTRETNIQKRWAGVDQF